ncbi:MAG: threonine synthase [Actinomycetota bacterium]
MMAYRPQHLECAHCRTVHDARVLQNRCSCGGTLLARYELGGVGLDDLRGRGPGMWRYAELLPTGDDVASLGEVETPLLPLPRFSERWGIGSLLKDDGTLPGGTFKARGAAVGLNRAVELGAQRIVMPSAGNAGGAWALYAARAGIPVTVTMAKSAPAMNQLEVEAAGAELVLVDGTIADAGREAKRIASETGAFLASTFNEPYRVEGKKTAWLETFDRLGDGRSMKLPGSIVVPVGGGVAAVAAAKAAAEVLGAGWATGPAPVIFGVQSDRCAPIARAFEMGLTEVEPWDEDPETVAAGLRVPAPSEGDLVLHEVRASGGRMVTVPEGEIVGAVHDLASSEGIFACPEGAATFLGAEYLARQAALVEPVVIYNTGAGSKYASFLAR